MLKDILLLAVPCTISVLLEISMELINTIFVSRLGDSSILAGLGLAHIIINLFCIQPMFGLNSGLETFVSQAYGAY